MTGPGDPTHPLKSRLATWRRAAFTSALRSSSRLRSIAISAGDFAEFIDWQHDAFETLPAAFARREELWAAMRSSIATDVPVLVLEFGVAHGYATQVWLSLLGPDVNVAWHGFDRFTGLPRAWRNLPAGTFDAGGQPPLLDDQRIVWHIGDVEDQLPALDLSQFADHQWLVLFDLDILEPSRLVWEVVKPGLKHGDLLYFDEAFDIEERTLLSEAVLPSEHRFSPIGATAEALALRVDY